MRNKDLAKSFLNLVAMGKVQEAYDKYVAPTFIHHNQYFKGDRQSLLTAMEESSKKNPNKSIGIKQAVEDDDIVITHSCVIRQDPNSPPIAVVHIFRFQSDQIVELWDLAQSFSSKDSPNENGMF